MLFDPSKSTDDQRLLAKTVYDQNHKYVGVVAKVNRDRHNRLFLLVQDHPSSSGSTPIRIDGAAIQTVDLQRKTIDVNLTAHPPAVVAVESLPLWQEGV
jgi:ribosomal 30S subunit maturation factor RimM